VIAPERIDLVARVVERAGLSDQTVSALRESFPECHFTYCLDDDIGAEAEPVREGDGFRIYLIDGRGHCMRFTGDQDSATGLVLAETGPDGDD
jgi:hypothetical protein